MERRSPINNAGLAGEEAPYARRDEQPASSTALEVLATSLEIGLTLEELEWLAWALRERAERKRRLAQLAW
jgi:hypothetical protein